MSRAALPALGVLLAALLRPSAASGQTRDEAAAEALFQQGRSLMERGAFDPACAKFEASERLDPAVGTLLNLGDCLERGGKAASAWARFRDAEAMASQQHQADRAAVARGRAAKLDGRLCRLAVRAPAVVPPAFVLARDGVILEAATYGEALPVDPGEHTVTASAPQRVPWSTHLVLDAHTCGGASAVVEVPALRDAPTRREPVAPSPAPVLPEPSRPSTLQRTAGWVTAGAGVATLAASGVLALDAVSTYHGARGACGTTGCGQAAQAQAQAAGTLADGSTATLAIGAAATAVGLLLWITAPSGAVQVVPQLVPSRQGLGGAGAAARVIF